MAKTATTNPSHDDLFARADISKKYVTHLQNAARANTDPERWLTSWVELYHRAELFRISAVQEPVALFSFIDAIAAFDSEWARHQLMKLSQARDGPPDDMSLLTLHENFTRYRSALKRLGLDAQFDQEKNANAKDKSHKNCPCGRTRGHYWRPEECKTLYKAVSREYNGQPTTLPKERCDTIMQAYESPEWYALRVNINQGGWKKCAKEGRRKGKHPSGISTAIPDPGMHGEYDSLSPHMGDYSTLSPQNHKFSNSTLINNCGEMHVVNDASLLVPGSFKPTEDEYLEAGASKFQISGRGTRLMRKALRGNNGAKSVDLVLHDVAVVEGFHVNIVSESRLVKKGVWYCGLDCTLRFGSMHNSRIMAHLFRRHNLVFLEYKPLDV
ncbi:hypothetical protein E4U15_002759 [Claviceps sp. LM218 group G6]|nr:hypothetical protein E4U15_002759 [Claviceps sp. LM218 group G6]